MIITSMSPENSDDNLSDKHDDPDICRDFLRNVCQRGKRCRYRHPNSHEAIEIGKITEYTFCHDYQNSGCRRPSCKFIHCTKDEEENYKQHGHLPHRIQQAVSIGIGVSHTDIPLLHGGIPICKDYLKGDCKRAARCKYRHLSSVEYQYELAKTNPGVNCALVPSAPAIAPREVSNGVANVYDYTALEKYDYQVPVKRRRIELEGIENQYQTACTTYRFQTASDYSLLEEENMMLLRKIKDLEKLVSDLYATNEVLLDQNARLRVSRSNILAHQCPPVVSVSQVVTPTITPSNAIPQPTITGRMAVVNTSLSSIPTLAITNNDVVNANNRLSQEQCSALSSPVTVNGQAIIPVSISLETLAGVCNHNSSLAQSLQQTQNLMSGHGQSNHMVSYPILSGNQINSSMG